jgi:CubicO group peptidase (beta-lactamase class C family)
MLTAIAVLQTVQAGQVSLDDSITTAVPGFHLNQTPTAVAGIKVRHLLSHSGGLSDYGETNAPANEQTDAALEQFLTGRFADIGYVASPPGALWAYANPDYMLAGLIAEKTSGVPYRSLMHDKVFAPLGMNRTFFLPSEVLADGDYAVGTNCTTPDSQPPARYQTSCPSPIAILSMQAPTTTRSWSARSMSLPTVPTCSSKSRRSMRPIPPTHRNCSPHTSTISW